MSTSVIYRVILDDEASDVFRDIRLSADHTLLHLHQAIIAAYAFDPEEMASFYMADEEWNQGDEIPLEAFEPHHPSMKTLKLADLPGERPRLLYVYDYLNLWTFFVEQIDASEEATDTPAVVQTVGTRPAHAPGKDFEGNAGKSGGLFDDAFGEEDDMGFDDEDISEGYYEE